MVAVSGNHLPQLHLLGPLLGVSDVMNPVRVADGSWLLMNGVIKRCGGGGGVVSYSRGCWFWWAPSQHISFFPNVTGAISVSALRR